MRHITGPHQHQNFSTPEYSLCLERSFHGLPSQEPFLRLALQIHQPQPGPTLLVLVTLAPFPSQSLLSHTFFLVL